MPEVQAPIVAVTVYTDRAQVTRRGRIALGAGGVHELTLGGLPGNLDADSLRAGGQGTMPVTIIGVESKVRHLAQERQHEARDLQEQLQALQDEDKTLERRDEALGKRLEVVQTLADSTARRYARALADSSLSLDSAAQLLDFVSAQTAQVQDERTALERQRRELGKKRQVLQNQLDQWRSAGSQSAHEVTVSVEAGAPGEFELELLYVVPGASWQPLYDARLHSYPQPPSAVPGAPPEGAPEMALTLSYLASIRQNTGENWSNVALSLSTAQPSLGSLPPKLEPVYIDVYRPPLPVMAAPAMAPMAAPARMRRAVAEAHEASEFDATIQAPPMLEAAMAEPAEVESEGATVTFNLPRPMDVPSDGQPHRGLIAPREFACRLNYSAVPRRVELAYLRATIVNDSQLSLLPGQANIFRNDAFVGSSTLEAVAPGQEFTLFLGPDEQVRSRREMTGRHVDKNFMGNLRRVTYEFSLKLENLKAHPVTLTVLDQIPVSRHEQVKVKLRHTEPVPATNELGELRWELVLPPGAKRELTFEYTVESPRDLTITGLSD